MSHSHGIKGETYDKELILVRTLTFLTYKIFYTQKNICETL